MSPALTDPAFYAYVGHLACSAGVLWSAATRHERWEWRFAAAWLVTLVAFTLIVLPRIA